MRNSTIIQFFHWYITPEENFWANANDKLKFLASLGSTHIWLPPAYKSGLGINEPGYAVYDLYDLGEFDQQGSVRTRYGTKEEYLGCINFIQENGMQVLADIVINHRLHGDEMEEFPAIEVDPDNRKHYLGEEKMVKAHTRFTFPGRKGKYSEYIWDWHSFTGFQDKGIFMIKHEYTQYGWDKLLAEEKGNFDLLMGCDVEFRNPYVREELIKWGIWYVETCKLDGFRLDTLKHINPGFFPEWLDRINRHFNKHFFCIGEYWKNDLSPLVKYIEVTNGMIQLLDVPLHFNLYDASVKGESFDLRKIFDHTLVSQIPDKAITFVDNHDTQPLQALESYVDYWFKPLAYALILLRHHGTPLVFYPDLFGSKYSGTKEDQEIHIELNTVPGLEEMMKIRNSLVYGELRDYFESANLIGWTQEGIDEKQGSGVAVVLSNNQDGVLRMSLGNRNASKIYTDRCGGREEKIQLNDKGEADFYCNGKSVSVWVSEEANLN